MQNDYNYLLRLFRIKLNDKIKEKMQKKPEVDIFTGKVEWKGKRGDEAKEEALKELKEDLQIISYYNPFLKKSYSDWYDDSIANIDMLISQILGKGIEIRNATITFMANPNACNFCVSKNGIELPIDEYRTHGGVYGITHNACRCGIKLNIYILDEKGEETKLTKIVRDFMI